MDDVSSETCLGFIKKKYLKNELQKHRVVDQIDINVFTCLHQVLFLPLLIYFINLPLLYFIFCQVSQQQFAAEFIKL